MLASETCALDIVNADFIRDVEPGEIVVINDQGVHSIRPFTRQPERFCVFEYIYFARAQFADGGHVGLRSAQADRPRTGHRIGDRRRYRRAGAGFRGALPRWASRSRAASRWNWVSSATNMSAAPSSSRASTSGIWV